MWAKRNIVFIICMLGLFLAPYRLFACHEPSEKPKQEEKSCCLDERQQVKDVETADCCKDERAESPKSDHHADDCGKHCGEKSCRTSLQCNPIVSVIEAQLIYPYMLMHQALMRAINSLIALMPIFPFGNLLRSPSVRLIAHAMSFWIGFSIQSPVLF